MNGHWNAVYEISARRHETNMGEHHLTEHGLSILQAFAQFEAEAAMRDAIGELAFHVYAFPE